MPILTSSANGIPHGEPPEGRKFFPLQGIAFVTGAEVFTWSSASLGAGQPSHIVSAWVDASNIAAGKLLTLNFNNGQQIISVAGGSQGYIVITTQSPVNLTITTNNGAAANCIVILYNYNSLYTGVFGGGGNAAGGGGGSSGSGGGSKPAGSGGYSGNLGGGRFTF